MKTYTKADLALVGAGYLLTEIGKDLKSYTNEERLAYARETLSEHPTHFIHWSARIGSGTVIGNDGFGYARAEDGSLVKIPHRGNVEIHEGVEIGSNVCIDRAVVGSTVIGEGTKLDNLIHIGHGAKIGKHCLLVAGCVIGGSADIGDCTFIGMNASIKNKIHIGKNCIIGAGAVVLTDVPDNSVFVGNPAKFLRENK